MTAWDTQTATFSQSAPIDNSADFFQTGLFIGKGGTKLYHTDANDLIYEYDMTTPYDISTLSLLQSKDVSAQSTALRDMWFTPDGLTMFVLDSFRVFEYNLSTAWDVSTASFSSTQKSLFEDTNHNSLYFRADGLLMFTIGNGSSTEGSADRVYKYDLSTPYDISTLTLSQSFHVSENLPTGIFFRDDGLRMYVLGATDTIFTSDSTMWEYPLTVAWAINTTTTPSEFSLEAQDTTPFGVHFLIDPPKNAGARFWHGGRENDNVYEYTMAQIGLELGITVNAILTLEFIQTEVTAKVVNRFDTGGALQVGARLVLFCDNIETNTGWLINNGIGQIFIDDPSFPNVIHLEALAGGVGVTERWARKDIGVNVSGDTKLEFSYDFQAMNGTNTARMSIYLQEQNVHPDVSTGSQIGCELDQTTGNTHHLFGRVTDGVSTVNTIQGGTHNQRTSHIYPPNQPGGVDAELLGKRFITVELKDGKLRISHFKDEDRTIHARGSPREVDATGINPTNLRFIVIGNSKISASARQFTGDIDEIYVTQNEPLPPLAINTQTATLIEDWESYGAGSQNPDGWLSAVDTNLPDNSFNIASAQFVQSKNILTPTTLNNGSFVKADGTRLYIIRGDASEQLLQFNLNTPWSISSFSGAGSFVLVPTFPTGQDPRNLMFKNDGLVFWIVDGATGFSTGTDLVEYRCTTPFDITTASIFQRVKAPVTPSGIWISPSGTKIYITSFSGGVNEYNLSTPFNVATISGLVNNLPTPDSRVEDVFLRDDGLRLWVTGNGSNLIYDYILTTPFNLSTATLNATRSTSPDGQPLSMTMKSDGLKYIMTGRDNPFPSRVDTHEYSIPPVLLTDIREVSFDQPNGGLKSFKLQHQTTHDGGIDSSMSSSVIGKRALTLANPDGGELLIPYAFTAEARSNIMSPALNASSFTRGGVYIRYEILQGAPSDVQTNDGLAFRMFEGAGSGSSPSSIEALNDLTLFFTTVDNVPPDVDNPDGSYIRLKSKINTPFQDSSVFDGRGWDFESHVKSITIGYWIDSFATGAPTGNLEALMFGDEINLIPDFVQLKDFTINSLVKAQGVVTAPDQGKVNAILELTPGMVQLLPTISAVLIKLDQEKEFFINAQIGVFETEVFFSTTHLQDITPLVAGVGMEIKEFTLGAKVVIRTAVNSAIVSAFLKRLGDNLCVGETGVFFQDNFTGDGNGAGNIGWDVDDFRIRIDIFGHDNIMRLVNLTSTAQPGGVKRAVKPFAKSFSPNIDFFWEFKHVHFGGGTNFASEAQMTLKETSNDIIPGPNADETTIKYRTDVVASTGPEAVRLEVFDKNAVNSVFSPVAMTLRDNGIAGFTFYPRITKTGNIIKLEMFIDEQRTTLAFVGVAGGLISGVPVAQVDVTGLDMSQDLGFISVGNYASGGQARQANEEFDDILVYDSLCPRFRVDSLLEATFEEEFLVKALLKGPRQIDPQVNAILKALEQEHEFTINALLEGANIVEPTVNALLQATFQTPPTGKFVDAILQLQGVITPPSQPTVDAILVIIIAPNDVEFTINAVLGLSEFQSILDVESVIGSKTGSQI